jgi:hypothetical protein
MYINDLEMLAVWRRNFRAQRGEAFTGEGRLGWDGWDLRTSKRAGTGEGRLGWDGWDLGTAGTALRGLRDLRTSGHAFTGEGRLGWDGWDLGTAGAALRGLRDLRRQGMLLLEGADWAGMAGTSGPHDVPMAGI